jgi:phage-related protein
MPTYHPDFNVLEAFGEKGGGFKTRKTEARSGKPQTAKSRNKTTRIWSVAFDWMTAVNAETWVEFFDAKFGAYESFYWFTPYRRGYTDYPCGYGNGTNTINLPYKGATATPVVKVNGATATGTWTANAGTGGEDRFVFDALTPSTTDVITSTFLNARLRPLVRFDDDYDEKFRTQDGTIAYQINVTLTEDIVP